MSDIPVRTQPLPLEATPYLERFNRMVEELRQNPKVELRTYDVNPPATEEQLAAAEEYFGQPLPEAMRRFYSQANGLELRWALKSEGDGRDPHGNINLMPIQKVFSWGYDFDGDSGEFAPLHPFDIFIPEACAALHFDGSSEPVAYYRGGVGRSLQSMEVDFAGYLELVLKSRGYWYWQKGVAYNQGAEMVGMADIFDDYDERFFFQGYSSEEDPSLQQQRGLFEAFKKILEAVDIDFSAQEDMQIDVPNQPENVFKLKAVLSEIRPNLNLDREWGVIQTGQLVLHNGHRKDGYISIQFLRIPM